MEQVGERDHRFRARKQVQRNGRSPGLDGITVQALAPYLKEDGPRLRQALRDGTCQPRTSK